MLLFGANSLHAEECILRAAVALFADARLLAPQIAVNSVALSHFVIAETLGEAHASTIGKLAQQGEHLPLDISGGPLGRVAEVDFVLDLQPAELGLEHIQFFISGHLGISKSTVYGESGAGAR